MDQEPDGASEQGDDAQAQPADPAPEALAPEALARDALAAVAALRSAAVGVLDAPLWRLSDECVRQALIEGFAAVNQVYAGYLGLLRELDSRPGAVEGAKPGAVGRTFLVHKLRRSPSQAGADLRAAAALAPDADPALGGLPRLGAALRAGAVSREHAEVAVKAMRRVPGHLLAEPMTDNEAAATDLAGELPSDRPFSRGDLLDRLLADQARRSDPGTIDRLGEYLQHAADPGGEDSFDPGATQRRGLSIQRDVTGMEIIRGELDAANGAFFRAALDALSKPVPARTKTAEDGTLIDVKDQRTTRQRRADAAGQMARLALGALSTGRGAEPPRIVIHTTPGDLRTALHRDAHAQTPHQAPGTGTDGMRLPAGAGLAVRRWGDPRPRPRRPHRVPRPPACPGRPGPRVRGPRMPGTGSLV